MIVPELLLINSIIPADYRIRPGAKSLIEWCKARGDVFLNTTMRKSSPNIAWSVDCATFLGDMGIDYQVRYWDYGGRNAAVQKSAKVPDLTVNRTIGYDALITKGYDIFHLAAGVRPDERENIEKLGGRLIEIPPWKNTDTCRLFNMVDLVKIQGDGQSFQPAFGACHFVDEKPRWDGPIYVSTRTFKGQSIVVEVPPEADAVADILGETLTPFIDSFVSQARTRWEPIVDLQKEHWPRGRLLKKMPVSWAKTPQEAFDAAQDVSALVRARLSSVDAMPRPTMAGWGFRGLSAET